MSSARISRGLSYPRAPEHYLTVRSDIRAPPLLLIAVKLKLRSTAHPTAASLDEIPGRTYTIGT